MLSDAMLSGVSPRLQSEPLEQALPEAPLNRPKVPGWALFCCFWFKLRKRRMEDTKQPIAKVTRLLSGGCRT